MELTDLARILNQHGWASKLINRGYGISVGSFWECYSLSIEKNYANNKLMISVTPTWLNWLIVLALGVPMFQWFLEGRFALVFSMSLIWVIVNIYRSTREVRQAKRLRGFLVAQGMSVESFY